MKVHISLEKGDHCYIKTRHKDHFAHYNLTTKCYTWRLSVLTVQPITLLYTILTEEVSLEGQKATQIAHECLPKPSGSTFVAICFLTKSFEKSIFGVLKDYAY